jgi:hypothetical protein
MNSSTFRLNEKSYNFSRNNRNGGNKSKKSASGSHNVSALIKQARGVQKQNNSSMNKFIKKLEAHSRMSFNTVSKTKKSKKSSGVKKPLIESESMSEKEEEPMPESMSEKEEGPMSESMLEKEEESMPEKEEESMPEKEEESMPEKEEESMPEKEEESKEPESPPSESDASVESKPETKMGGRRRRSNSKKSKR